MSGGIRIRRGMARGHGKFILENRDNKGDMWLGGPRYLTLWAWDAKTGKFFGTGLSRGTEFKTKELFMHECRMRNATWMSYE